MRKLIPIALRKFLVCAWSVLGVLTVFRSADMSCTSTMKHECSICLPLVAYEPYVNRESWMFRTSPMKCGWPVCHMYENYVDGDGKLLEDREGDSNIGNLTN